MHKKVIIVGASGHGRVIADIVRSCGDEVMGFLDDREADCFSSINILGKVSDAVCFAKEALFIIGIGDNKTRQRIAEHLMGFQFYTAIHPSAVIASDVIIGRGTAVMANAVISTGSRLGDHCIVNTAATIDHDNDIGDFIHISPGVHTAGSVTIGDSTWIGIGAVVSNNLNICGNCVIGAGAVSVKDISESGIYVGVPARRMRRRD